MTFISEDIVDMMLKNKGVGIMVDGTAQQCVSEAPQ